VIKFSADRVTRAKASYDMTFTAGTRFGRYELRSPLGVGGMGEVFLAQDTQLDRVVALKILPTDIADNAGRIRRFTQEAKAVSSLNHPNILTIFEIGQTNSTHFIATEFIDGQTLRQRMKSQTLKLSEVLNIVAQVADALAAAHEAGIVHRDIKPENIMVRRRDGYVKVLDFGLAKLTEPPAATVNTEAPTKARFVTDPGVVMGTVQYMSPEQARGLTVDARTDIFSLGVMLYEIVAGRVPFEGQTKSDVIASILNREPSPLARYSREVPETLEWIVSKSLRKDREERYQTARELLTDLRSLKQRLEFAEEQERSVPPTTKSEATVTTIIGQASIETLAEQEAQTVKTARPTISAESLVSEIKQHKRGVIVAVAALVLIVAGVVLGLRYIGRNQLATRSEPFGKIKLTRLTTNGKVRWATISPDGKYIAHVTGDQAQQSIWLRHIATGSDKEIASSNGATYCCPIFSRDGSYIYYIKTHTNAPTVVYQVPVLGGAPRTIIEDVDSQPALSPDGLRFAFIRGRPHQGIVELLVANVDGTGEQKLATYDSVNFFPGANIAFTAWSPDGETIVIGVPASDNAGGYRQMLAVRVQDGTATQISSQRWFSLGQLAWLADGSGLIFTASDQALVAPQQLWYISYPGGEARRITNDLNDYRGVSLTADNTALVTVPVEVFSSVWLTPDGDASRAAQITSNKYDGLSGIAFAPDGRVVYTSRAGNKPNLWIVNADGTGRKQLTADAHINFAPTVSPDGRYVVFVSDRAGKQNIWRMDIDGANPKQLTSGQADENPNCSPDSQWVAYTSNDAGKQRLWRVPIDGGNPVQLTDYSSSQPVISPDGKQIACRYLDEQSKPYRYLAGIIPFEGGQPTKRFDIVTRPLKLRWASDGRALTYILTRDGVSNIWSQPVDGSKPVQLTDFKSDQIYFFDWSRDGHQLSLSRGSATSDVVLISDLK
jgi:serine/threonine protein kinase/Tol biopolymer transport system component